MIFLPEQMKVKLCSMDDLPSSTKLSDQIFENEDDWCNERECDEDMCTSSSPQEDTLPDVMVHNSAGDQHSYIGNKVGNYECYNENGCGEFLNDGTLQEETISDFIVHNSEDDQQDDTEKTINKVYGDSQEVREDCREKFGFITSMTRMPSSNVATTSSDDSSVELRNPAREQLTNTVADDVQSPGKSYLRPSRAKAIYLTTPAPQCRSGLCGRKSRVVTTYPQINDLAMSPNFIHLWFG